MVLAGEITTKAVVDFHQIARDVIKGIGYDNADYGIDYKGCAVLVAYDKQSPDIAQGVDEGKGLNLEQGAGDQGMMFGYAVHRDRELMPLPIYLAHRLVEKQAELRKNGKLKWLRPDAKSQVTVKYVDGKPSGNRHRRVVDPASPGRGAQAHRAGRDRRDRQAGAAEGIRAFVEEHQVPDQPDRPFRDRWPAG